MEFPSNTVQSWLGQNLPAEVLATADLRVILRSIEGRNSAAVTNSCTEFTEPTIDSIDEEEEPSTDILKFSHSCLYESWDPLVIPEVENNLGNLSGLCVHENIHKRLQKIPDAWTHYKEFLQLFDISDKADYWAFFYQNWNLLRPSFQLKLKITNAFLSEYPIDSIPTVNTLQFTQVLTKQSSMYNTWKQMIQFSDESGCPIEEIPRQLLDRQSQGVKVNSTQAKKITSMSLPKELCTYNP
jgi:hypothetical protein